jgi:hypothetical protein
VLYRGVQELVTGRNLCNKVGAAIAPKIRNSCRARSQKAVV